jgi:hypothetical protein
MRNTSSERRADPRVQVDIPVVALFKGEARKFRLVDVSRGGALIERADEPAPSAMHTIVLNLGHGRLKRVLARTVWTRLHHHAIRFVAQDDFDRLDLAEAIDEIVSRHAA